jgi:peptidyl-prolyl cis-trans isomerase B (cyclophilin B)
VATSKREKELARMRAERQAARRAAAAARRRQRNMVIASVVAVALVALGAIFLATKVGGRDEDLKTADGGTPTPTPSAAASNKPGNCTYTKSSQKAVKEVLYPPITEVETTQLFTARLNTNLGPIVIDLNTVDAPCTVNNFRSLIARHYYDNTPCHRLTTQGIYVLQCGDPSGKGTGGPGYTFADENLKGAKYPRGTIAMANSGPNTNGSQFFLVYKDTQLDPNYTPFGTIVGGLDILEKVAAGGSTPEGDGKPKVTVNILTAHAVPKKA